MKSLMKSVIYRLPCGLRIAKSGIFSDETDGLIYVSSQKPGSAGPDKIRNVLKNAAQIDEAFASDVSVLPIELPARKFIQK